MAELEVDQSNLPKVQEVCQGFAVLEDGALAHNLQEQEIEQFYSSNVQRNQLVQRDIREAKRLQDEEKQKVLMHQPQTTQQLEKLDSEYAQMIQEEIRRCAEEARRRELEDEEIAKRIQEEEEELCVRHRTTHQTQHGRGLGVVGESAALDLGQLEQVLLDEELARRLQKEEERFVEESQMDSPRSVYPAGDFRVAQVAQDEEIARFIQKQEIRAKRRSQELDSAGPRQEFREDVCDRQTRGDRQVHRQRLDSEGLQSPTDDFTPDYQAHSPISRATHQQPIRNIAEELDPTFQRNDFPEASQINEANQGQASQKVSSSPIDEPAFIPPTKRQADKVGRAKAKEKKEQFKQKENCKTH